MDLSKCYSIIAGLLTVFVSKIFLQLIYFIDALFNDKRHNHSFGMIINCGSLLELFICSKNIRNVGKIPIPVAATV